MEARKLSEHLHFIVLCSGVAPPDLEATFVETDLGGPDRMFQNTKFVRVRHHQSLVKMFSTRPFASEGVASRVTHQLMSEGGGKSPARRGEGPAQGKGGGTSTSTTTMTRR